MKSKINFIALKRPFCFLGGILLVCLFAFAPAGELRSGAGVSGALVNGFRVLPVDQLFETPTFRVFRGDYIKFDMGTLPSAVLSIPALDIETRVGQGPDPYFKMKQVGAFDLFISDIAATLVVIEYTGVHYRALSAAEAQNVIQTFSPVILDVRTRKEYAGGHLKNALHLPVSGLQNRLAEIEQFKDDPILIYCATGNRSTVASKILIDHGFTRVFNLKFGIADWVRQKYPIVR